MCDRTAVLRDETCPKRGTRRGEQEQSTRRTRRLRWRVAVSYKETRRLAIEILCKESGERSSVKVESKALVEKTGAVGSVMPDSR